mgnify:FL=1
MTKISPVICFVLLCGCPTTNAFWSGHAAEYRAEYEILKAAVLMANTAENEAVALRDLASWFKSRPYGYTLSTSDYHRSNGVNIAELKEGEEVFLSLHAKSDYEPRSGGFRFIPKYKFNLLLLENK